MGNVWGQLLKLKPGNGGEGTVPALICLIDAGSALALPKISYILTVLPGYLPGPIRHSENCNSWILSTILSLKDLELTDLSRVPWDKDGVSSQMSPHQISYSCQCVNQHQRNSGSSSSHPRPHRRVSSSLLGVYGILRVVCLFFLSCIKHMWLKGNSGSER